MKHVRILSLATLLALPTASLQARELITWQKLHLDTEFYSEGASFGDMDQDGHTDVVSGPFIWHGPEFETRTEIYPPAPFDPKRYSDNFFSFTWDLSGDSLLDVLVIGFPGKEAFWYENPGTEGGEWTRHLAMAQVDNESPTFTDLTGDGNPEIVCSKNGVFGYAEPDWRDPTKPWTWRPISPEGATGAKFTHGLGVGDVNGDGRMDLLEKGRWWEQPASLDGDPEWQSHRTEFGGKRGGAQMYAWDFDGDGDNDVLTSLDSHGYGLAWYEQVEKDGRKTLEPHIIVGEQPSDNPWGVLFTQKHGIALEDMDGDGLKDIVTGKRFWAHGGKDPGGNDPAVLYWFQTQRTADGGVEFIPHRIDDDSGVGTEVKAGDVNGDGFPDIVVGNKKGTFIHLQQREEVDQATWEAAQPQKMVNAEMRPMSEYGTNVKPTEAAANMSLPEGFTSTLIAAEPDIAQPITFTFDDRGRIWLVEGHTYPKPAPEGEGKDRILILEDTNHDGTYDSRKVFAEGLNLVSGMEVGFGGVWVGAAPKFMFIPDADGDDVPDSDPVVLLDGWGTQDTHETLNSFTWGPDGWLYGCHGVFTHSLVGKPGTPDEEREFLNCAVWRYHPLQHEFEVFAHGTSNPWGLDFNEYGQAFITACVIPHLWHVVQGAYYERQGRRGHERPHLYDLIGTIADHAHYAGSVSDHAHWGDLRDANADIVPQDTFSAGGGHAHCGLTIYRGDNFPNAYRGALLFHNLHGHRINWDHISRKGSSFVGSHRPDFMFANDHWYVGTAVNTGPDGAVYTADWHDDTTCHRTDPLEWDRSNGRLFRIHYGTHEPAKIDLASLSDAELVELHLQANAWYPRMARRLLQERAAAGELEEEVAQAGLLAIFGENPSVPMQLRAMWTLHAMGLMHDGLLWESLGSASEYIRAWSIQFLAEDRFVSDDEAGSLADLARTDPSPAVRLYLASALQRLSPAKAWPIAEALAAHEKDAGDHNLPNMLWYGTEPLVVDDPERALQLAGATKLKSLRQNIYRRSAALPGGTEAALQVAMNMEKPEEIRQVLQSVVSFLQDEVDLEMPDIWPSAWKKLSSMEGDIGQFMIFLAGRFGDTERLPEFRSMVADSDQSKAFRMTALESLIAARDADAVPLLHDLVRDSSEELRSTALEGLAVMRNADTTSVLLETYGELRTDDKLAALNTLTAQKESALALLQAVGEGLVPRNDISVATARQIQQYNDAELTAALDEHWGVMNASTGDKAETIAAWKDILTPAAIAEADLGNGRLIYNQTCFACHQLYGQGMAIGPDLTGANRPDLNYLLENIIDPNALIGKDYQLNVFTLKDGGVASGMVREGSQTAWTLILPGGAESTIAKANVESRQVMTQSLMPEGILENLEEQDAIDLIAYLKHDQQVRLTQPGEHFLEGESLKVLEHTGKVRPQGMGNFKNDTWSGDRQLWWTGARAGDLMILEFEVPEAGQWAFSAVMSKAHDYGIVGLNLNHETELIQSIDLYEPRGTVKTTGVVELGTHELSAGKHRLTVSMLNRNPDATPGFMFGLDSLSLVKQ